MNMKNIITAMTLIGFVALLGLGIIQESGWSISASFLTLGKAALGFILGVPMLIAFILIIKWSIAFLIAIVSEPRNK